MKRFIARTVGAAGLLGLAGLLGCCGYKDVVDPCYPQRYNWQAQEEVCEPLGTQVNNGHILDQTLWNHYFETGKARLNAGGRDKLDQLVQRRPYPDKDIYLATAHDITYQPDAPAETYVQARSKLDSERTEAVRKYLAAVTPPRNVPWQIYVHDPMEPSLRAPAMAKSIAVNTGSFTGTLGGAGGGGGAAGGGAPAGGAPPAQ
jgi:hypothetical protein